jgi:hypothetical protein
VGEGWEKMSPRGGRGRGEERPFREGEVLEDAALRRSSVALRRASRASSSEVWEETFCFLGFKRLVGVGGRREMGEGGGYFSETAASRSARELSILKRSFRAREKERAIVLGGDVSEG